MGFAGILILVLSIGAPNQLTDYIDTAAYWQEKGVTVTVEDMTKELAAPEKAAEGDKAVRRLMAIRALGELKDAKATATLNGLAKSQTPFEAEYAERALAEIKGEAYKGVAPKAETLAKDIMILPKGCGVVLHARTPGGARMTLKDAMAKLPANMPGNKEQAGKELAKTITQFAEKTGNMRVDAVTLGLAGTIGNEGEGMFIVVIGRGQYDRAKVQAAIKASDPQMNVVDVDGVEVLSGEHGEFNCILDKGERFIMVGGPVAEGNGTEVLPVKEVVQGMKTGKGGITQEPEMVKLVESAGLTGEMFAVMKVTDTFRKAEFLKPFETVVLTTKAAEDGTEVKIVGTGKDAEAVGGVAGMMDAMQKDLKQQWDGAPEEAKTAFGPLVEGILGAKVTTDKTTATLTGKLKGKGMEAIMPVFMMMGGAGQGVPPQPMEPEDN